MTLGYSGTPLPRKLGVGDGGTFAVVGDPGHVDELLSPLPAGARRAESVEEADVVREVALPIGLVDTKVAAIDATWSGLRLVWRRERR